MCDYCQFTPGPHILVVLDPFQTEPSLLDCTSAPCRSGGAMAASWIRKHKISEMAEWLGPPKMIRYVLEFALALITHTHTHPHTPAPLPPHPPTPSHTHTHTTRFLQVFCFLFIIFAEQRQSCSWWWRCSSDPDLLPEPNVVVIAGEERSVWCVVRVITARGETAESLNPAAQQLCEL